VVNDPRPVEELRLLPIAARPVEVARSRRDTGCMGAIANTDEAVYELGPYRVTWWMESDRGRPGPAQVRIGRPDLCEDGELVRGYVSYGSFGPNAFGSPLHADTAGGVEALVLPEYPRDAALVFRLVPGPGRRTPP
jgi:hypothetical protein